jgi:high-affinity nickel-transport protein
MNVYILYKLVKQMKILLGSECEAAEFGIQGAGCLFLVFKKLFKMVDRCVMTDP